MRQRTAVALWVLLLLVGGLAVAAGPVGAAHDEPDRTIIAVLLEADGDATVVHITSYDLNDEEERSSYEALADDEDVQRQQREAAIDELAAAAADAEAATGREMRVHSAESELYEQDGWGRFEVRARWDGLAAVEDGAVVVTEPFASGYEPDRQLAIHGPVGYQRAPQVHPEPGRARANSSLWHPDAVDFEGFYARFEDPSVVEATPADSGWTGYRVFLRAAAVALIPVVIVLLALRRERPGGLDPWEGE